MMKSGVTFWQMPSEEEQFLAFLSCMEAVVAYTAPWKEKPEDVRSVPLADLIYEHDPHQLMFGPKSGARLVEAHSFEGRVLYNVRLETSSLMMYRRGKLNERMLALSNLAVYWTYLDDDSKQFVNKDTQFISWSKQVLAWVRKRTPERQQQTVQGSGRGYYRLTRATKAALNRGEIELKTY